MPKAVVLSPDGKEAWVTNFGNDRGKSVFIFDAATGNKKGQVSFQGRAVELCFSKDGARAFVSDFDTGELIEIDTETRAITRKVYSGPNPKIVTLSPDGKRIYVSNWSGDNVSVFDAQSLELIGRARTGKNPRGSDTDASGRRLFVADFNNYSLSVVDTETLKEIKRLRMKRMPRHVTATPDGRYILVTNMGTGANALAVVDPAAMETVNWIEVGTGPKTLKVSPDSRYAFTADFLADTVSITDLELGEVIKTLDGLGDAPCGLDLSADGKILYVTSWYSNDLWALKIIEPPRREE